MQLRRRFPGEKRTFSNLIGDFIYESKEYFRPSNIEERAKDPWIIRNRLQIGAFVIATVVAVFVGNLFGGMGEAGDSPTIGYYVGGVTWLGLLLLFSYLWKV
ncbi:hypothetical protein A2933_02635 [Candidatus Nomurabacteria bacterium RIFCSPLOWO2_01_FULL_46_18]|uniref:Uncharacterized protein n=1 Tax=Candidatus Nomurabacteria bacterium RIFCSPLOWO2_01_FULL_46_18 TaxID=1801783 RepID=A0A1F6XCC2_9BACT|nr:MAG: hypothetical protein A2933_02635 [Candidatus Nomurabacteria bacterium RIFCSPLOWO2_01_FULL_46_18]